MRKLWEDHVTWTRLYIVSALANLPDKDAATKRLLQNQKDIGKAIAPFYGANASKALGDLLTQHIMISTEIVADAKAGRDAKVKAANLRWEKNSDEVATFLHNANKENFVLSDLKKMMREHLKLTTDELMARIRKDWSGDVVAYDKVHEAILHMADELSAGISKQFPAGAKLSSFEAESE